MKNMRFIDDPGMVVLNAGSEKQALLDKIVRLADMRKYSRAMAAFNANDLNGIGSILADGE